MGLMDAINPENTVEVKFSDYRTLLENTIHGKLLMNAIKCRIPEQYIREMLTGKSDELQQYKDTGLSPEEVTDTVKELVEERIKVAEMSGQIKTLEDKIKALEDEKQEVTAEPSEPEEPTGGDNQQKKPKTRRTIDIGKIVALRNAGWKIKDIALEMHLEPAAVSNALYRYNKSLEDKTDE